MMSILFLLVGLGLILSGANFLTDGAAALAKRFNISSLVIGLTIVAFGTSAPELTVSIVSAINGSAELSIGNVVGSNIFNILMIVGVTAVVAPITITKGTLTKEIPLAILSCVVVLICANDVFLETGAENILNRADGLLMLCFFAIFLGYTFAIAHDNTGEEQAEIYMALFIVYRWRACRFDFRWSAFCQWVERDSPVVGSRRVCYRIDSCCYGDFSS